ncbi:MAG TPA: hypothetical protein VMU56_08665 [Beijerinckiaceae bacterium]|nr:hypothetical protein [Beijerinckiaceae bacterium]
MQHVGGASPKIPTMTNEQTVRQRRGLPSNEPAPEQPEGVSEAKLKELEMSAYLNARRLQGQASQVALSVLPAGHVHIPADHALGGQHLAQPVLLAIGLAGAVYGSGISAFAAAMAIGGIFDIAMAMAAVGVPLLLIGAGCLYYRNRNA